MIILTPRRLLTVIAAFIAATIAPPALAQGPAATGVVHVIIPNVKQARGMVHVDLCPEANFLKRCPFSASAPARAGETEVIVRGVPPGEYAAQIFHDENGNQRVDRALFGIPKEGVGFSNNMRIRFRAPRFSEARFTVTGGDQRITVMLQFFGWSAP
jgi:uncharacterized protein (DUF2141 family)